MSLLFCLMLAAFTLLCIYIIIFWNKNRLTSRFRVKLTVLFLLLVLLPVIPLTFLTAHLLTTSAKYLTIPGISDAIETSIETLKQQTQEKGKSFLDKNPDFAKVSVALLDQYDIDFIGTYQLKEDSIRTLFTLKSTKNKVLIDKNRLSQNISPAQNSHLSEDGLLTYYSFINDTIFKVIEYTVNDEVMDAKREITHAHNLYNALALIKRSILQKNLIWSLAVLIVVSMTALAVLVGKKLSQSISEPIQQLVEGMNRVAADDLNQPVTTSAKHEFRFMIDTFNHMMEDLKQTRHKLIQAERLAAWQQVARMISHEIKNSLTPISIALRRIRNKTAKKEFADLSLQNSLGNIDQEIHSLSKMATQFSEFAKLPAPDKSPVNLNDIITSVVTLNKANAGNITLITHLDNTLPSVRADKYQLRQVLNNLIQNSMEAMSDQGTISIHTSPASSSNHTINIKIQDNGCGLDPEQKDNIFKPYFTTKERGTGLGLAIVKRIIDEHQGTIRVESEKNKGTTFSIDL